MLSRLDAEQESIKQNLNTSNDILRNVRLVFSFAIKILFSKKHIIHIIVSL